MKRIISFFLVIFIISLPLFSCSNKETKYTISIYYAYPKGLTDNIYTEKIKTVYRNKGEIIGNIGDPKQIYGYTFKGYYTDKNGTQFWSLFKDEVKGNMTLYLVYSRTK